MQWFSRHAGGLESTKKVEEFLEVEPRVSRSSTDGTGLLQSTHTTHESNLGVRHAALIINFPTYIARLTILCTMRLLSGHDAQLKHKSIVLY